MRIRIALACLITSAAFAGHAQTRARPNILFIFSDDHAAHAISAYGSAINKTPNLDRLAREGMIFRSAFVTNSICAPSRATVLTGQFGHLNGVPTNVEALHPTTLTFPKLLRASGYQTAVLGKWHLKTLPNADAFDYFEVVNDQGDYYNPLFMRPRDTVRVEGYATEIITDRALEWIGRRDQSRPFMLMLQHKAPHRPWQPGPAQLGLFEGSTFPEPPTLFDDWKGRAAPAHEQEMTIARHLDENDLKLVAPGNLTPAQLERWNAAYGAPNARFLAAKPEGDALVRWKYQRYIADYVRVVTAIDDNVGRVLAYLDSTGLARNTIVIYSSDQGFFLGDHGWFDKRWMYEESLRTPLLIRWPGVVRPRSVNQDLVQNLDYAETMLDMAGVPIPASMQGRSLVPLLRGKTPADWRDAIYYQYFEYPSWHMVRRHYGVRTKRYKLIHYYEVDAWELFDLRRDPRELRSVYGDASYKTVLATMKNKLHQLRVQYHVPATDPVPYRPWPPQP
ncbi:MAG TPA: sulfatase [Gemmatimonadaceae bacterium]|nr:sulfatase [Gemmatimonadaceae bacterium]